MTQFYQKNWFYYLLIAIITLFVWHKVLYQTFLGEGYYYFNSKFYLTNDEGLSPLGDYDNFARLFFQITAPIFKDNLQIYMATELLIILLFFISIYTILVKITGNKFLAFTSVIFFSTSYVGLFEYLAVGNYQRFIQRIPNLIPAIFSFYYLWKFFKKKKGRYLGVSILLYVISILMGHFSTLMLPLFIIYSLVSLIEEGVSLRLVISRLIICTIFVLITIFLTGPGHQHPQYSLMEYLKTEPNILPRVFYQIPLVTIPISLLKSISSLRTGLIFSLALYLGGMLLVFRRLPKLKTLYLTIFISMVSVMFLYMYVDSRLNVLKAIGQDRYFLLSTMFATMLWAMILKAFFNKRNGFYVIISALTMLAFIVYNTPKIWSHIDKIQYQSEMNKKFIAYIKENKDNLTNSIIVSPYYLTWPSALISDVMLNKNVEFFLPQEGWEKILWDQKGRVFVFDYDYREETLINLTSDFRNGKKIKFRN